MRWVNLAAVAAVSYNIGHDALRAALSCALVWAALRVAAASDALLRARAASRRANRPRFEMEPERRRR